MSIKVSVAGANGKMGNLVLEEIKNSKELGLACAFDIEGIGKPLFDGVVISDAAAMGETLRAAAPEILIDFTTASSATENICLAAGLGIKLVVGTTGFSEEQKLRIKNAVEGQVAAVISPNFSIGVNVFWNLIQTAAMALKDFDMEIIEAHHNKKKDAPSGTALRTLEILQKVSGIYEVVNGREGLSPRKREIGVHAVRAGDIVGDHTVLFAGTGERIEIKHQAHSRSAFAKGAVQAARWVASAPPGIYTMDDVLTV
jgi:4-hydroxy-tetrahydrodipicolinate reductase